VFYETDVKTSRALNAACEAAYNRNRVELSWLCEIATAHALPAVSHIDVMRSALVAGYRAGASGEDLFVWIGPDLLVLVFVGPLEPLIARINAL